MSEGAVGVLPVQTPRNKAGTGCGDGHLFHLGWESGHFRIGQCLGDDRESHGESSDEVHPQPLQRVARQPGQDGQPPLQGPTRAAAGVWCHVRLGQTSQGGRIPRVGLAWVTQSSDRELGLGEGGNILENTPSPGPQEEEVCLLWRGG